MNATQRALVQSKKQQIVAELVHYAAAIIVPGSTPLDTTVQYVRASETESIRDLCATYIARQIPVAVVYRDPDPRIGMSTWTFNIFGNPVPMPLRGEKVYSAALRKIKHASNSL